MTASALALVAGLAPSGCLSTGASSYQLATANSLVYGFSGELWSTQPSYGFFRLSDGARYTLTDDTFTLSAYLDSSCASAANSSFTISSASVASTSGVAQYSGVSYTWPTASQEGPLYFKIRTAQKGLSLCSGPVYVVRHFGNGSTWGAPGVAGGAAALLGDQGYALIQDSVGRYIVGGTSKQNAGAGRPPAAIWRYNPDGTKDTSFGGGTGASIYGLTGAAGGNGATLADTIWGATKDSSGNFIGVGISRNVANATGEAAIWRYNLTSLSWDLAVSFGTTGSAGQTGANENDHLFTVKIDSQGRYVAAGHSANTASGSNSIEAAVWRYIPGTGWDTSFGPSSNGSAHFGTTGLAGASGVNIQDRVRDLAIDSRGRYVMVGQSKNTSGGIELALWRWDTASNSWDTSFGGVGGIHFGTTGAAGATGASTLDVGYGIRIDSSGRYVIAGRSKDGAGSSRLTLWRYNTDGSLDSSFGSGGIVTFSSPEGTGAGGGTGANWIDIPAGVELDSSGRIVVAGYSYITASTARPVVWRYTAAGALDTSFVGSANPATGGATYGYSMPAAAGLLGASVDVVNGMLLDQAGRIVLTGYTGNGTGYQFAIWRFLPTGAQD